MTMVYFLQPSLARHHLLEQCGGDLTDVLANIKYASVFETFMAMAEYLDTACEFQELLEEDLNAHLEKLDVDPEIRKNMEQSSSICLDIGFVLGQMTELLRFQKFTTKGMIAEFNEQRTILAANARRSAEAAEQWREHQQEFRRLVSEGMKRAQARDVIGGRIAKLGGEAYSDKTLRKWLR